MSHDLLHETLRRATRQSRANGDDPSLSPRALQSLHLSDDDDAQVEVRTPLPSAPGSVASTPSSSRSASPTRAAAGGGGGGGGGRKKGGAGKPRRDKTKERERAEQNKNPIDPFLRFPGEVLGRVLGELGASDLLAVGLVCKRWRRSQTLNYTWFLLLQSLTYVTPEERKQRYSESNGLPTWRASEAKEDWAARFATIFRRDDLEDPDGTDTDENGLTMREERELKWKEENEAQYGPVDKVAMREFYKGLRNKKMKGKTGKGSIRTIEGDGLGDIVTDS
ncbi:hypothetical protein JCM11251_003279 [Rhodosporidiobolus azoricus]